MIPLSFKVDFPFLAEPLVVRLQSEDRSFDISDGRANAAYQIGQANGWTSYDLNGFTLRIQAERPEDLEGDVVLLLPGRSTGHRLIRAGSNHNTLLVTEQCDQACVICSQPPKSHHVDLFDCFEEAVALSPEGSTIGISGGEPTLHKQRLARFLLAMQRLRPDVAFHVLTNAQHFDGEDLGWLTELAEGKVTWGVPIYGSKPDIHDRIVAKPGAFARLEAGLAVLATSGSSIELRTVPMRSNATDFIDLAFYITTNLPFVSVWAIMQLENIGFARKNWGLEFLDTSTDFLSIGWALDLALTRGLPISLYNFPLCTVPPHYRQYCARSISDWKQKYLDLCSTCRLKSGCSGVFAWHPDHHGFANMVPL